MDHPAPPQSRPALAYYLIVNATMFLFGFIENIKGVSFPLIKHEFGVSYDQQGGLVSSAWFGYVIFCLVASLTLQRFGLKRALLAGYALIFLGALATLAAPSFWAASLALIAINAGFGFWEVGTNAMGTVVFTVRAALMMNLLHFFYGFGAIAGPVAAGFLSDRFGLTWRQIYLATLVPTAAFALFILFTRFRLGTHAGAEAPTDNRPRLTFGQAFRQPLVWLFSGTLGFMEIIEFGASNWGGLYLKDVYGLDPRVVGAGFVSLFYVLFTVSRLGSGLAIERLGYHRSLLLSCWATIVVLALGFALGRRGIWLLPGTGLFIAIMWPTLMALAMHAFGRNAAICTSAIITLSGAINGLFQLVIGVTNQHLGYAWGYRSCVLYAFAVLIMLHFLGAGLRRNDGRTTA